MKMEAASPPCVKMRTLIAPPKSEQDPHRLAQRQKQIEYGKKTVGYIRYRQLVEKSRRKPARRVNRDGKDGTDVISSPERQTGRRDNSGQKWMEVVEEEDPQTPNIHQICSKRSFDGQVRKWRRMLHKWDPSSATGDGMTVKNIVENDALKRKRCDTNTYGDDDDQNENDRIVFRCNDNRTHDNDVSRQCVNLTDMSTAWPNGNRTEVTLKNLCQRIDPTKHSETGESDDSDEDVEPVILRPCEIHKDVDTDKKTDLIKLNRHERHEKISETICERNDRERHHDELSKLHDGKKEDASTVAVDQEKGSLDIYADWDSDWDSDEFDPDSIGDVETMRKLTQPSS